MLLTLTSVQGHVKYFLSLTASFFSLFFLSFYFHVCLAHRIHSQQAGVFEVLLVRLACMFDSQTNSMICLNGLVLKREALHTASNARFLMDSMFDFAERMNSLRLTDNEIALFCAVVVIAPGK